MRDGQRRYRQTISLAKAVVAEDLVAEDLDVVARLRVDVHDDAPMGCEKLADEPEPLRERLEVRRAVAPAIVEGDALVTRLVHPVGQERRVEVRERDPFAKRAPRQRAHHVDVVSSV